MSELFRFEDNVFRCPNCSDFKIMFSGVRIVQMFTVLAVSFKCMLLLPLLAVMVHLETALNENDIKIYHKNLINSDTRKITVTILKFYHTGMLPSKVGKNMVNLSIDQAGSQYWF